MTAYEVDRSVSPRPKKFTKLVTNNTTSEIFPDSVDKRLEVLLLKPLTSVHSLRKGPHMGSGRGSSLEAITRASRTVYFLVIMIGSFLVSSAPLLVSMADVITPCVLLSTFSCCTTCFGFKHDWAAYSFRTALIDIPLLSLVRSLASFCAYSVCGIPTLTYGPYLATTAVCGLISTILLILKVFVFSLPQSSHAPASSLGVLRMKYAWEMHSLILSSMVLALGHIVVAYRTRCQARRKRHFCRLDQEAVLVCKVAFNGYQKSLSSPFPAGKMNKTGLSSNNSQRDDENDVPARLLADKDSLFMVCRGLLVHYKICEESGILMSGQIAGKPLSNHGRAKFEYSLLPFTKENARNRSSNSSLSTPLLSSSVLDGNLFCNLGSSSQPANYGRWPTSIQRSKCPEGLPSWAPKPGRVGSKISQQVYCKGVIFIHGFGGGVFSWRHVMYALASQVGCLVVAFDRPGWGLTSRPSRANWERKGFSNPYELQSQVDLLFAFCLELNLRSVVLVGHDDGGLLAIMAAARSCTCKDIQIEVKGVVLVSTSLSREVVPTFARVLLRTSLGRHMLRPLLRSEIGQVANRRAWHDASKLTTDVLDLYKAPLRVEGWDKALAEVSRVSTQVLTSNNAAEWLKPVQDLPALVVAGVHDILVPLKSAQALAAQLPLSTLVAIPSCGHLPHEENPRALLEALIPFISCLQDDDVAANPPLIDQNLK